MNPLFGLLFAAIGLFMLICGLTKTNFIVYRLMVARSRLLWGEGDNVHRFYQVVGVILIIIGILVSLGFLWN